MGRWNWGAFLLNWIWGLGNSTYIALLMFVPFVNIAMPFVLGFRGNEWAWRNRKWDSLEQFKSVQKKWAIWGLIVWLAFGVMFVGLFFGLTALLKNSEAYRIAMERLEATPEAMALLGPPLSTGFVSGKIETSNRDGSASLSIPVRGSKARGTLYVQAVKEMGLWRAVRIELEIEGRPGRMDLNGAADTNASAYAPDFAPDFAHVSLMRSLSMRASFQRSVVSLPSGPVMA